MSITDATSNLSTSYTEQTTVTFNAGTLANIDDCITEIESKLRRGTLSANTKPTLTEVKRWLARAKEELVEIKGFTFKRRYASVSTVASQYRYALPPDFNGGMVYLRDTTNDHLLTIWNEEWFNSRYPDPSAEDNDEPLVACIKNMEVWLAPPPGGAYTLEIEYDRTGADNDAEDVSWLPEIERFRICDFALAEAFESIQDYSKSDRFRNKWLQGLGKAIKANGKRKWKRMGYQCLSWQQHYDLRNSQ